MESISNFETPKSQYIVRASRRCRHSSRLERQSSVGYDEQVGDRQERACWNLPVRTSSTTVGSRSTNACFFALVSEKALFLPCA